jgi:hypothetical protein
VTKSPAETMPRPFKSYQLLFNHDILWTVKELVESLEVWGAAEG